ncbi:MAG: tRNA (adenosine(37)-N6)-threonylcarbamoyltransferase complex dimerization subunit type 1 TsaB [Anaerovoracaceae bacterium]
MYILAIETTGPFGSVALINENEEIISKSSDERMNHLRDLMPMAQEIIDETGIKKSQLTAVAASIGPGSFTGIRIGVSTARAVAQALELPCISVPTLDTFKLKGNFGSDCQSGDDQNQWENFIICPIFDARRNQVYGGIFTNKGETILKSGPYMLEEVLSKLTESANLPIIFYGDGIDAYEEKIDAYFVQSVGSAVQSDKLVQYKFANKEERYQTATMVAMVALSKYRDGELIGVDQLIPDYMRVAEAESKLKNGILAKEHAAKMARMKEHQ